jgi:hypothetical protein
MNRTSVAEYPIRAFTRAAACRTTARDPRHRDRSTAGPNTAGASFVQDTRRAGPQSARCRRDRRHTCCRSCRCETARSGSPLVATRCQRLNAHGPAKCDRSTERSCMLSGSASDVSSEATARSTSKRNLTARRRRKVGWGAFDLARAGRAAERRAGSIARNQMQCLRWVVRNRSRLAHMLTTPSTATCTPEDDGAGPPCDRNNPLIL